MKKRIDGLQVLRFIGIGGITLTHLGYSPFSAWGLWGTSIFFILSGFLMAYTYCDRQLDKSVYGSIVFAYRKMRKLYPLYLLTLLAMTALWFVGDKSELEDVGHFVGMVIQNLFMIECWTPHFNAINPPAWFLSAILFCYILFPLNNSIKDKRTALRDMVALFLIEIGYLFILSRTSSFFAVEPTEMMHYVAYYCPLIRFLDFLIGCNLYHYFSKGIKVPNWVVAIIIICAIFVTVNAHRFNRWWMYGLVYLIPSSVLVLTFASEDNSIVKLLTNKVTLYLGGISPFFFLVHVVVFTYLDAGVHFLFGRYDFGWMPVLRATVGVGISIGVSELYRIVIRRENTNCNRF